MRSLRRRVEFPTAFSYKLEDEGMQYNRVFARVNAVTMKSAHLQLKLLWQQQIIAVQKLNKLDVKIGNDS
jgi:hypothetical protein